MTHISTACAGGMPACCLDEACESPHHFTCAECGRRVLAVYDVAAYGTSPEDAYGPFWACASCFTRLTASVRQARCEWPACASPTAFRYIGTGDDRYLCLGHHDEAGHPRQRGRDGARPVVAP